MIMALQTVRRRVGAATIAVALVSAAPAARAAPVAQGGPAADAIRAVVATIKLPPGFHIELYALVPEARAIAVAPGGGRVFVGTTGTRVFAVTPPAPGKAAVVEPFAPRMGWRMPNGVCFAPDGTLYVAEQNRVTAFPDAARQLALAEPTAKTVVPLGGLIPKGEESGNHSARVCRIGPDDKLYVALGQPYNVPPAGKVAFYAKIGMGGIVRMDRDGRNREVFASGIRNSVGLDFNPADKTLWFTDNQVDGMGDDIPPGEIDHATKPGQTFGFPWYGGGHIRTREYKDQAPPADAVFPAVEEVAHAADLGISFYRGQAFPAEYRGAIFSAQHGSWNRTEPIGARVMVTKLHADGTAGPSIPFAEGWRLSDGSYAGRPVDVAELPDGSLLVSDDSAGALYRISYDGH